MVSATPSTARLLVTAAPIARTFPSTRKWGWCSSSWCRMPVGVTTTAKKSSRPSKQRRWRRLGNREMPWPQNYDPLGNAVLSTIVAAIPIVFLLAAIALFHVRIHLAALGGLIAALLLATGVCHMPLDMAAA